jgi:RNA polymerase sigma factor (sigma-70 family)
MSTATDQEQEPGNRSSTPSPERRGRMTAEEEATLARAWRHGGDTLARERLVTANLGLVVAIAQRYRNSGVPFEELIAEGNLGLIRAVDGFDPDCGPRLSTYAAYWIRQGISRAFAASTPRGRLNPRERRDLAELEREARRYYTQTGAPPTNAELASALGWSMERVAQCRAVHVSHARPCSLDQPRPDGVAQTIHPPAPETRTREPSNIGARLDRLLESLPAFQRSAVEMWFGLHGAEPQSVDTIARSLDHTRRETRRALRGALARLAREGRDPHSPLSDGTSDEWSNTTAPE